MSSSGAQNNQQQSPTCPVCLEHTRTDSLGAAGIVLSAAEALITGDKSTIISATASSEPFDFHVAVSMYVEALYLLGDALGRDVEELIHEMRRQLNAAHARNA